MSDSYFVRGFLKRTLSLITTLQNQIATLEAKLNEGGEVGDISGLEAAIAAVQADLAALATVATSGSYNDLGDRPVIPAIPTLATVATSGSYNDLGDRPTIPVVPNLATVATSGSYNDLSDRPTIPVVPNLATVATSGSYNDLGDRPVIPAIPTLATVATSGNYNDLSDRPTIPVVPNLATVATSGSYNDLRNRPTIPVVPNLATVATSGSYNDLRDRPVIPNPSVLTQPLQISSNFPAVWLNEPDTDNVSILLNSDYLRVQRRQANFGPFVEELLSVYVPSGKVTLSGNLAFNTNAAYDLGTSGGRIRNIYLQNSPVVASDEREKFDKRRLTAKELEVGLSILDLAYTREGDPSLQFGVSAQQVRQAFVDRGLDPADYSLNIHDSFVGENGAATETFGVRYTELFVLLLAAIRDKLLVHRTELDDHEARLTALEGG